MLVSDAKGRDIKIDAYTLSFHGRLLIEGAEISLNYGQRYGLLGENGSGKVCAPLSMSFCDDECSHDCCVECRAISGRFVEIVSDN